MPFYEVFDHTDHEFQAALRVVSCIESNGHEAWLVGGCVRDAILGRKISDIDIATSASWEQVESYAQEAGLTTHRTGIPYGTITVCVPSKAENAESKDSYAYEVTTYRSEGTYGDGRHPDSVSFCATIQEDLSRRDFTMNALAWHPIRGLVDPYGGADDIELKVIRAVGNPIERFSEDALRIMRACRFESQLGFTIDSTTLQAMREKKHRLTHVATERIVKELDAFVLGDYIRQALLDCVDVISPILPELAAIKGFPQNTPYHCYDVLEHTAYTMENVETSLLLRWAALLHDIGKPAAHFTREDGISHFFGHAQMGAALTEGICIRLGFPKKFGEQLVTLATMHDDRLEPAPKPIKRVLMRLDGDEDLFRALCALKRADSLAHAPDFRQRAKSANEAIRVFEEMKERNEAWCIKDLAINGDDLIAIGYEQGPKLGAVLNDALEEIVNERIENERGALLSWVQQRLDSKTT